MLKGIEEPVVVQGTVVGTPVNQPTYAQPPNSAAPMMYNQSYSGPGVYTQQPVHVVQAQPQPLPYYDQNGNLVPYGSPLSPTTNGGILPSHLGVWRADFFERAFTCKPDCLMSWFCPCFVVGQLSDKLKLFSDVSYMNYTFIVGIYFALLLLSHYHVVRVFASLLLMRVILLESRYLI